MRNVHLSQIGLALIVLEGQLEQERQNERRWAAREREAREHRNAARRAIERHFNSIQELRDRI